MNRMNLSSVHTWRNLLLALLFVLPLTLFTACGDDDEPTTAIDYYLEVEEEFLVDGSIL